MSCRFTWCKFTVAEFKWYWGTQLSVVKGQTAIIGLCLVGGKMCRPLINHSWLKHRDWDRILKKQPNRSTVGLLAIQSCWQTSCWWQTWTTLGHLWVGLGIHNGVPSSTNSVDGKIWKKNCTKVKDATNRRSLALGIMFYHLLMSVSTQSPHSVLLLNGSTLLTLFTSNLPSCQRSCHCLPFSHQSRLQIKCK